MIKRFPEKKIPSCTALGGIFFPENRLNRQRGFTLAEAVIVIVVTGIIAAMVAVFIRMPVQGYFDSVRRAQLTDAADTAVRRIARDLHLAVPNSVRLTVDAAGISYLEFLQTKTGGYYRKACSVDPCPTGAAAENALDFSAPDNSFDVLGGFPAASPPPLLGDRMVVFNLGVPGADAYAGNNTALIRSLTPGANSTLVTIGGKQFPFESPNQHFQVIDSPVTYVCAPSVSGGNGTGTLTRYWGYAIQPTQSSSIAGLTALVSPPTVSPSRGSALLADSVSACTITPPENLPQPGIALVTIRLKLRQGNEKITFYQEVHVNNVP